MRQRGRGRMTGKKKKKKTEPCAVARAQKGSKKEHMMEERQMKCKES